MIFVLFAHTQVLTAFGSVGFFCIRVVIICVDDVHQVRDCGDALLELKKPTKYVWPSSHAPRDRYNSSAGLFSEHRVYT